MILKKLSRSMLLLGMLQLTGVLPLPSIVLSSGALQLLSEAQAQTGKKSANAPSSAVKLYGQVNELLSACANAGIEITSTTLPAHIIKVRMGSSAFYAGLQDNDVILKGALSNNQLKLTFKRGVSVYAVELATEASGSNNHLAGGTSSTTLANNIPSTKLTSGAEKDQTKDPAWKKLKNYDIVILIDQSGSMGETVDGSGLSKWEWCSNQLTSFASQALASTGKRFTIGTFNHTYNIRHNCSPQEVEDTFTRNKPGGGTELATPLNNVLTEYINGTRAQPLLVVVLTDGMPNDPEQVESTIIDISKRVASPDQIQIVMFEIGNDASGQALLTMLDAGLERAGARYDIVEFAAFNQLQRLGLKQALYDAFSHSLPTGLNMYPGNTLDAQLDAVRKQLKDARARSGQQQSR